MYVGFWIFVVLIAIAAGLFLSVRLRYVTGETLQILANAGAVGALIAAALVFVVPSADPFVNVSAPLTETVVAKESLTLLDLESGKPEQESIEPETISSMLPYSTAFTDTDKFSTLSTTRLPIFVNKSEEDAAVMWVPEAEDYHIFFFEDPAAEYTPYNVGGGGRTMSFPKGHYLVRLQVGEIEYRANKYFDGIEYLALSEGKEPIMDLLLIKVLNRADRSKKIALIRRDESAILQDQISIAPDKVVGALLKPGDYELIIDNSEGHAFSLATSDRYFVIGNDSKLYTKEVATYLRQQVYQ